MAQNPRRRNTLIAIAIAILALLLLLLTRCPGPRPAPPAPPASEPAPAAPGATVPGAPAKTPETRSQGPEVLTAATLVAPPRVPAGAAFPVTWTGPDNTSDYLTVVKREAPENALGHYKETQEGKTLQLTAPIEPGPCEVRYVAGQSRKVLGRAPIEVDPVAAAINAPAEIDFGKPVTFTWTGPNNKGDYITIVPGDAPDAQYGQYENTEKGSPMTLTAPTVPGNAELRYVTGDGRKVLARRVVKVRPPQVEIAAPDEATAGATIEVIWKGPGNAGDYITAVPAGTPDSVYGNYTLTGEAGGSTGSALKLLLPIATEKTAAELRYIAGQGNRILARRPISLLAPKVTLSAPPECSPGSAVSITWTGPNYSGDFLTIVPKGTPDGGYGAYAETKGGSPLTVTAPREPGEAEIRYVAGQGNKVLARIALKVVN